VHTKLIKVSHAILDQPQSRIGRAPNERQRRARFEQKPFLAVIYADEPVHAAAC
jgi:hypothetical protein